jgi:hypothetical protein
MKNVKQLEIQSGVGNRPAEGKKKIFLKINPRKPR